MGKSLIDVYSDRNAILAVALVPSGTILEGMWERNLTQIVQAYLHRLSPRLSVGHGRRFEYMPAASPRSLWPAGAIPRCLQHRLGYTTRGTAP